jgi:HSP20 family protein
MVEVNVVKQPKPEASGVPRAFGFEPLFEGSLFNVSPFALMRRFTEDMDRVFGAMSKETAELVDWRPAIDVKEEKGKLVVKADLPGVNKEDVKVSVTEDGVLTVEGERKHEKEEKREGYFHSERGYGRFFRSVQLPQGAKTEQVSAQFTNGVLEIGVPVPEVKQKSKEIPINEGVRPKTAAA